jgi:hypothetical protein
MQPQVLDGIAMTHAGDVVLTLWSRPVTAENWAWHFAMLDQVGRAHRQGALAINVILTVTSMPDAQMRGLMQKDYTLLGARLRHMVAIAVGSSIWVSVLRAMLRSMAQLAGVSSRLSIVATLDDAMIAVTPVASGKTPSETELRRMIATLYLALDLVPPAQA